MNLTRIFALVVTLGVLSTASVGQESQAPAATQPATPPAATSPAAAPAAAPAAKDAKPPPALPGSIKDNEFIPTEELQPDEDVTFPVDI